LSGNTQTGLGTWIGSLKRRDLDLYDLPLLKTPKKLPVVLSPEEVTQMVFRSGLYLAAVIDSTWIVLVLASSAPTTVTFCPANFSGACWSLNV
jgi:hypothetical protein